MVQATQFEVQKKDLNQSRLVKTQLADLRNGEILVEIERFAFTANNVTYGVVGERIGYWKFFPPLNSNPSAQEDWGVIPVWGIGVVAQSRCDDINVGERLYGYFPMGSHLVMAPTKVKDARFMDGAPHRSELPPVYNNYNRLNADPHYQTTMDDERVLLMPLYATSYCLYDFLLDNNWFGAERDKMGQIIMPSASSKTALGLAYALHDDEKAPALVGFTSKSNEANVRACGLYNKVLTYDDYSKLDADRPSVIVDMSGNGNFLSALHKHLSNQMLYCSNVGVTHYHDNEMGPDFNRERSAMFFAPGHIQKRNTQWGPGVFESKALAFWQKMAVRSRSWLKITQASGPEKIEETYREALAGDVPANEGRIIVL